MFLVVWGWLRALPFAVAPNKISRRDLLIRIILLLFKGKLKVQSSQNQKAYLVQDGTPFDEDLQRVNIWSKVAGSLHLFDYIDDAYVSHVLSSFCNFAVVVSLVSRRLAWKIRGLIDPMGRHDWPTTRLAFRTSASLLVVCDSQFPIHRNFSWEQIRCVRGAINDFIYLEIFVIQHVLLD